MLGDHHQDALTSSPTDELGEGDADLQRLAQTNGIGNEDARAKRLERLMGRPPLIWALDGSQ